MKFKRFMMLAALLVSSVAAMVAQEMQMPPIPIDKNVKIGKLDNGLTYYIRKNNWPENVANFYIAQRVGSIQENEDQRGLAHFLEHMAFNGSEHFPDSALLDFTRRIGVDFGRDLNAYTSIDQTVYRICDVPTKRVTALDSCILVLKDWSNGLTLKSEEIEKERGVIHQEWQLGEGPTQRIIQKLLPRLYPGSKYGERLPIGLMSVVDGCNPQVLRDYYNKWPIQRVQAGISARMFRKQIMFLLLREKNNTVAVLIIIEPGAQIAKPVRQSARSAPPAPTNIA